jgi:quercetin dioxygenase-like cupin family protein
MGARYVVLEGNLAEAAPYTLRLQLPAGYTIPMHSRPDLQHVTVLSGTFVLGLGDRSEPGAGRALPAGSFFVLPPDTPHSGTARGDTTIQLHGVGPWDIHYVDPNDDPRGPEVGLAR